jgi:hypothetical protein
LFEVLGKGDRVLPEQMAGIWVKLGVELGLTVMFSELLVTTGNTAHDALLVKTHVMISPLMFELLV